MFRFRMSLSSSSSSARSFIFSQAKTLEADVNMLNEDHTALSFWVGGFKRVRLFIVEQALQQLELEINNSLGSLGLLDWHIKLDVERENKSGGIFHYEIKNTDRSIGARVAGEIAQRWGNYGMKDAPITVKLKGVAGQSFGVFNVDGLNLHLQGDANDYVGKGMAGGEIVITPAPGGEFDPHVTPIVGNTCLYGATGGALFAVGTAGERFGVRNSGAIAVVEGCGDHGCEYMTGGTVVSLGSVGVNFGAGMSGGMAFVLDEANTLHDHLNGEMVEAIRIDTEETEAYRVYLRQLLETYVEKTGSAFGQQVLGQFSRYIGRFWLVKPRAIPKEKLLDTFAKKAA